MEDEERSSRRTDRANKEKTPPKRNLASGTREGRSSPKRKNAAKRRTASAPKVTVRLPPDLAPDEAASAPRPANGWGIVHWLLAPIGIAAIEGLEFMHKHEVPPRLAPLAGRRPRKIGPAEEQAIADALGRHEKFTELVLQIFREMHAECFGDIRGRSLEDLISDVEEDASGPEHLVCLLVADGRFDDARALAAWAEEEDEAVDGLREFVGNLAGERADALGALRGVQKELASVRRAHKRAEQRLARVEEAARGKVAAAKEAEVRARGAEARLADTLAQFEDLRRRVEAGRAEIDAGRRERRDLLAELEDLQARFLRVRRQLREVRAKLPPEPEPVRVLRAPDPPPSLAELNARLRSDGPKGILDAKRISVIVDGWNVGLGHVAKEKLEDTRRELEQALERYHGRTGNKVMVVYDGREVEWFWVPTVGRPVITRVFTPEGETADDYIVSELETGTGGPTPVVVTSDRELRERCIAEGAFVLRSEWAARALGL